LLDAMLAGRSSCACCGRKVRLEIVTTGGVVYHVPCRWRRKLMLAR